MKTRENGMIGSSEIFRRAAKDSFRMLSLKTQARNPVMLLVYLAAILTAAVFVLSLMGIQDTDAGVMGGISVVLWMTVLTSNFAEAAAREEGKAQTEYLRASRHEIMAHRLPNPDNLERVDDIPASLLQCGDAFLVWAGEMIPAGGVVLRGTALVDESAVTGESEPVVREAGEGKNRVSGGSTVLSDWLVARVTEETGDWFLDRLISGSRNADRQRTPGETALRTLFRRTAFLSLAAAATVLVCTLPSGRVDPGFAAALAACFVPVAAGALLPALGISAENCLNQANVLVADRKALETAGEVDLFLVDKTGTVTFGSRQASGFFPVDGCSEKELAQAALFASLADKTPEGRSIAALAKEKYSLHEKTGGKADVFPFSPDAHMSGANVDGCEFRKGAADAVRSYVEQAGGLYSEECRNAVDSISREGGTPLVVAKDHRILGVVFLKDVIKNGVREQFAQLRGMGVRTVMVTGDNPVTAAAVAAEAGVDAFLAEKGAADKLRIVREYQGKGHRVAMTGDGDDDVSAFSQADVSVALNSGTQAAKEAADLLDLDSSPAKMVDIVRVGRRLAALRSGLTAFSAASGLSLFLILAPVLLADSFPWLASLDFLALEAPGKALFSAALYNAVLVVCGLPLLFWNRERRWHSDVPAKRKRRAVICGLWGFLPSFPAVKAIDFLLTALGLT